MLRMCADACVHLYGMQVYVYGVRVCVCVHTCVLRVGMQTALPKMSERFQIIFLAARPDCVHPCFCHLPLGFTMQNCHNSIILIFQKWQFCIIKHRGCVVLGQASLRSWVSATVQSKAEVWEDELKSLKCFM